jgi:hypothetical protein
VQLAGGAEHHHPPALDSRLLLQQAGGFGVEAPQEASVGGHLGLQDQDRQLWPLWRRQKQPIEPVFPLFQHAGAENLYPIASAGRSGSSGRMRSGWCWKSQ